MGSEAKMGMADPDAGPGKEPLGQSGYFGVSHKDAAVAHDTHHIDEYIARIKHALLFNQKITLADHMVVNSPNFRIAYHTRPDFREIIADDFVELAHFELDKHGNHLSLPELRHFCKTGLVAGSPHTLPLADMRLFHPKLPAQFKDDRLDRELEALQGAVLRRFPKHGAERDWLFTGRARAALDSGVFRGLFNQAGFHDAYETAFDEMTRQLGDQPLGIIHFDPEHQFSAEQDIYHHMARLTGVPRRSLVARYGREVARAHRAMLLGVEIELLGAHAILPADLIKYGSLALKSVEERSIDSKAREEKLISINLSTIRIAALASLTAEDIVSIRNSERGKEYFATASAPSISFEHLTRAVTGYCRHIRSALAQKSPDGRVARLAGYIRLLRGSLINEAGKSIAIGTIVAISASEISHYYSQINFGGVIKTLAETAAGYLPLKEPATADYNSVRSYIDDSYVSERLTQYQ